MDIFLKVYNFILLGVDIFATWGFVIGYMISFKRWFRSEFGQMLVTMSACLGAFLLYSFLYAVFPTLPGRAIVRTILFTALTISIVWRLIIFIKLSRATKRVKEINNVGILKEAEPNA